MTIEYHTYDPISLCIGNECPDCFVGSPGVEFALHTPCRDHKFVIHYDDGPAKLSDLVPVARQLTDEVVAAAVSASEKDGCEVSCKKGCNACCHYMVSVSSAEAFRIREEINQLPQKQRKALLRSSVLSARYLLRNSIPNLALKEKDSDVHGEVDIEMLSEWYASLGLACPLLSKGACSVYESRPLVCREHMVTSPAFACKPNAELGATLLKPVISFAEVLTTVCNKFEGIAGEAVLMPLSLAWCEANAERGERSWPADVLVKCFVKAIEQANALPYSRASDGNGVKANCG